MRPLMRRGESLDQGFELFGFGLFDFGFELLGIDCDDDVPVSVAPGVSTAAPVPPSGIS